jgi:hypothetical protein
MKKVPRGADILKKNYLAPTSINFSTHNNNSSNDNDNEAAAAAASSASI